MEGFSKPMTDVLNAHEDLERTSQVEPAKAKAQGWNNQLLQ
jgi:hypothetical protein